MNLFVIIIILIFIACIMIISLVYTIMMHTYTKKISKSYEDCISSLEINIVNNTIIVEKITISEHIVCNQTRKYVVALDARIKETE